MLNRGFFSLQLPWIPSMVAVRNLVLNAGLDAVFYRFGIWGIPLSTSIVNIAGTAALLIFFRRRMPGFEVRRDGSDLRSRRGGVGSARRRGVGCLAPARLGARPVAPAQIVSLGAGLALGYAGFFGACRLLNVHELETLMGLRRSRA